MEHGLRECLLSVRLGHILIQHSRDADRKKVDPQVYFSHLPPHIEERPVLLMDPIVGGSRAVALSTAAAWHPTGRAFTLFFRRFPPLPPPSQTLARRSSRPLACCSTTAPRRRTWCC